MRVLSLLVLLILFAIVGAFAVLNGEKVPINYFDQHLTRESILLPMSVLILGVYLLGMLSGWSVVGFLRRSFMSVTDRRVV